MVVDTEVIVGAVVGIIASAVTVYISTQIRARKEKEKEESCKSILECITKGKNSSMEFADN